MSGYTFFRDNRTPEQKALAARFSRIDVSEDPSLWACKTCGTVVNDQEKHAARCRD